MHHGEYLDLAADNAVGNYVWDISQDQLSCPFHPPDAPHGGLLGEIVRRGTDTGNDPFRGGGLSFSTNAPIWSRRRAARWVQRIRFIVQKPA